MYAKKVEDELRQVERDSVDDYIKESGNMAGLYTHIQSCDGILENMEKMLGLFQSDLGNISGEIHSLQEQSLTMNVKLKNRKAVQASLSDFVGGMSITDELVASICSGPIDSTFMEFLADLDKKLAYANKQPDDMAAAIEARDEISELIQKAVFRIRDFFSDKIQAIRKPNSNMQMAQNTLLAAKDAYTFVEKHAKHVAAEIQAVYVDSFGKCHYSYFKNYTSELMKLQFEEKTDQTDLMGADDTVAKKSMFFSSKPSTKKKSTVFTIGTRASILKELEAPIIVPHTGKATKDKGPARYPYEILFRSIQFAMKENCAREFLFCNEFFGMADADSVKLFHEVMGKTMALMLSHEKARIAAWFDSISLVLCARILNDYQKSLRNQNIPCVEPYYKKLLELIWPRFMQIIDLNAASIAQAEPSKFNSVDAR